MKNGTLELAKALIARKSVTPADQEVRFRAHEQRADEKLAHVVEERGLHALEAVAEELQRPAGDEERRRHAERAGGAQAREGLARRGAGEEERHRHRHAEDEVEAEVVDARGDRGGRGERDRHRAYGNRDARAGDHDRQHDHRDAGEMGRDVAPVAVVRGVLREVFFQRLHSISRTSLPFPR